MLIQWLGLCVSSEEGAGLIPGQEYLTKKKKVPKIRNHLSSVTQSCPTLCDCIDCSTPGLPVYHQHLEFTQTHVH